MFKWWNDSYAYLRKISLMRGFCWKRLLMKNIHCSCIYIKNAWMIGENCLLWRSPLWRFSIGGFQQLRTKNILIQKRGILWPVQCLLCLRIAYFIIVRERFTVKDRSGLIIMSFISSHRNNWYFSDTNFILDCRTASNF